MMQKIFIAVFVLLVVAGAVSVPLARAGYFGAVTVVEAAPATRTTGMIRRHLFGASTREGLWTFERGGRLTLEQNFIGGKKWGFEVAYYPAGNPQSMIEYRDDVRDGSFVMFDSSGRVMQQGNYESGKLIEGSVVNTAHPEPMTESQKRLAAENAAAMGALLAPQIPAGDAKH